MRNETEFIKSTKERTLTAKAYKFIKQCKEIIANQRGTDRRLSQDCKIYLFICLLTKD